MTLEGRLICMLAGMMVIAAAVYAADDSRRGSTAASADHSKVAAVSTSSTSLTLPKAERQPIAENFHGTKVVDDYRWLEDGTSPATEKWVAEEMAYTRAILDPCPAARRFTSA